MTEDGSFNAFIKAKLEEGIVVPELHLESALCSEADFSAPALRSRRSVWWLRPALKIAAAVAVLCGALAWLAAVDTHRELQVSQAIELLEECRLLAVGTGVAVEESAVTAAERLLAWQDAPFMEVVNSRFRE